MAINLPFGLKIDRHCIVSCLLNLVMFVLLLIPGLIILITQYSIAEQMPMCNNKIPAEQAALTMQNQPQHIGYHPEALEDLSQVSTGFNTACEPYINKTVILETYGQWIEDDSMFATDSLWAKFHYHTVSIVGWDLLEEPYTSASVKSVTEIGSVNIFSAPTWWREQLLFVNLDYAICAYFNDTTRLIASARTKSAKIQQMMYATDEDVSVKPNPKSIAYVYDIIEAPPNTELLGPNKPWGRCRLHFIDQTFNDYGGGRKCYVWSHAWVGDTISKTIPFLPRLSAVCFTLFAGLLYWRMNFRDKHSGYEAL